MKGKIRKLFAGLVICSLACLCACGAKEQGTSAEASEVPKVTASVSETVSEPEVSVEENDTTHSTVKGEDEFEVDRKADITSESSVLFNVNVDWSNYHISKDESKETATERYTRLKEGEIGKYVAGTSNGYVFPFLLNRSISQYNREDIWDTPYSGLKWGFVDETGMIVSDFGYDYVVYKNGWWMCKNYSEKGDFDYVIDYISADGKGVIRIDYYGICKDWECYTSVTDDCFYVYITYTEKGTQPIKEYKYDHCGNLISKRIVNYDESILGILNPSVNQAFYSWIEEVFDGEYLNMYSLIETENCEDDDWEDKEFLINTKTGRIVLEGFYNIKMCANHTFLVQDEQYAPWQLYDCEGTKLFNQSYRYINYLSNDYYLVYSDHDKSITIYKLELGNFNKIKTIDNVSSYVASDDFIEIEDKNNSISYYRANGEEVDITKDTDAYAFSNARSLGFAHALGADSVSVEKTYFLDPATAETNNHKYYGIHEGAYDYAKATIEMSLYDVTDNKLLMNYESYHRMILNYCTVLNGIFSNGSELYNLETGECIFRYNPFVWENVD